MCVLLKSLLLLFILLDFYQPIFKLEKKNKIESVNDLMMEIFFLLVKATARVPKRKHAIIIIKETYQQTSKQQSPTQMKNKSCINKSSKH